jgi:hypothetical protein
MLEEFGSLLIMVLLGLQSDLQMVAIGFQSQLIQMEQKLLPSIAVAISGLPLILDQPGVHTALPVECTIGKV